MKQAYIDKRRFTPRNLELIKRINAIATGYMSKGLTMTVRQLYYQLVSKDLIPNTMKSYKSIVLLVTQGRLAGLIDWDAIEDRARSFQRRQHWRDGKHVMEAASNTFHKDMWADQEERVFVLIEKEALSGVVWPTCHKYDVPLLACKGYPSASVMREFCIQDIIPALTGDQRVVILHLGDHDPSGIDMTRDIGDRVDLFCERDDTEVVRLALNMPQVERLKPPPNPAKQTDSRYKTYVTRYGRRCWELDAIPPDDLTGIIQRSIVARIDWDKWERTNRQIAAVKKRIRKHAMKFKG